MLGSYYLLIFVVIKEVNLMAIIPNDRTKQTESISWTEEAMKDISNLSYNWGIGPSSTQQKWYKRITLSLKPISSYNHTKWFFLNMIINHSKKSMWQGPTAMAW